MEEKINYFTCTLGQATKLKRHTESCLGFFSTAVELIDYQAQHIPNSKAVGFANFKSGKNATQGVFNQQ